MSDDHGPCALCGTNPAAGYAGTYDDEDKHIWLCHDTAMSCYHRWTVYGERPLKKDRKVWCYCRQAFLMVPSNLHVFGIMCPQCDTQSTSMLHDNDGEKVGA